MLDRIANFEDPEKSAPEGSNLVCVCTVWLGQYVR